KEKKKKEKIRIKIDKEKIKKITSNKIFKILIKICGCILVIIALIILFYALTEYKPKATEKVTVSGEGFYSLNMGDSFTIMTWNIGYAALGDNADYFRENGKMVQTADRNRINYNINGIRSKIDEIRPNVIMMQEIDKNSKRVSHVDEVSSFKNHLSNYSVVFASNYKVTYLAYPLTDRVGKVHSGIATLSKYTIESAKRVSLPSNYVWPAKMMKEKDCFLISYIPIKDSEKKLVLINVQFSKTNKEKNTIKQMEALKEIMEKEEKKGNYIIVGGDFKQTFKEIDTSAYPVKEGFWEPRKIIKKEIGDNWQTIMDNKVPSSRSLDKPYEVEKKDSFQYYVIDGFIVSNNIEVQEYHTEDYGFEYSYHNPVIMKINIKKEENKE
ncbi:MAG: endonuclease/exonuclease/phosphatase family protein, partial [Bacilli bacterium]|nr:endonuclease/exonuclease/phosphatase family protein [Bacilli bacterium]